LKWNFLDEDTLFIEIIKHNLIFFDTWNTKRAPDIRSPFEQNEDYVFVKSGRIIDLVFNHR
jgi:hypothetical protein